ncbi:hypothetical protein [Photobacterium leiognathi]|uniref:hypothetical protein n=1 Tax=Photobacterium leiognathi TaxID=553611 RepID=UPI002980BB31|nr:hypothetical protein [Photobacterium leiognathi]
MSPQMRECFNELIKKNSKSVLKRSLIAERKKQRAKEKKRAASLPPQSKQTFNWSQSVKRVAS